MVKEMGGKIMAHISILYRGKGEMIKVYLN
jgi:hypothetical protein